MDGRHATTHTNNVSQRRPTAASSLSHRKPVPSSSSSTSASTSPPPSGPDRRALDAPGARSCTYNPHNQASQPLPPRLRSSKSTSNLSSSHRYHHHQGPHHDSSKPPALPPGFIDEDVPSRAYQAPSLHAQESSSMTLVPPEYSDREIRRVKSSSDITTATTSSPSSSPSLHPEQTQTQTQQQPSAWKKAVDEVQYFAGSIVARAAESTKHYTVIRHSRALVWYHGPSTTVTISVLSDKPLPATRSVWLQQRGHSGNMGMSVKALFGASGTWIDVTPAAEASATDIPAVDERGIQRDFRRFAKKASGKQARHQPRETLVVRIPASCEDGYFRLVVCSSGKRDDGGGSSDAGKVLCGSPVFRVASTSSDISVVRGASLATMPLEMGIKVASTIGQQWAQTYTAMAGEAVQTGVGAVTNSKVSSIGQKAYESYQVTGAEDRVNESWESARAARYEAVLDEVVLDAPVDVVGGDAGPAAPFPVKFDGAVVEGLGTSREMFGFQTANLSGVRDSVKANMSGVFAAWACVVPDREARKKGVVDRDWHEAVVSIGLARNTGPKVVGKTVVSVHIINDFEEAVFFGSRVKVLLMGYLHRSPSVDWRADDAVRQVLDSHARDVMVTVASLGRENWGPQETLDRIKTQKGERNVTQRMDSAAGKVSAQVDRVPVHWAGVRSESSMMRDKKHGTGGMWIAR